MNNFNHKGKGYHFKSTNPTKMKKISIKRRWLISTILTFLSVFFATFIVSLQEALATGHISSQIVIAALFAALVVASRSILKAAWERYVGIL